jgi:hypothetical protein
MGLSELGSRLRTLGVHTTYFATHSVVQSSRLESLLQKDLASGVAEVGTHFHAGDTPPFRKAVAEISDNILRIPDGLLEEKFSKIHRAITSRFGKPKSYRSGAWALDQRIVKLLRRYSYQVDSSVTPGICWKGKNRPSYLGAPKRAYFLSDQNPAIPDHLENSASVLEIPVSIWSRYEWSGTLAGKVAGDFLTMPLYANKTLPVRLIRALRPRPPQWLRPAFAGDQPMEETAEYLDRDGADYLHIMCHSNELWPGASPYCTNQMEIDSLYSRMESIFKFALDRGYIPVTLQEYANRFSPSLIQNPKVEGKLSL